MKKIISLIRASMTSDMNLFKIKTKSKKSALYIPLIITFYLMFMMWAFANSIFEKLSPSHAQYILLSLAAISISILTIMEGIYKSGPLIFNCKDDDILLSLPIKKRTVLFIRIFKFYIFELLFNSLFLLPIMIAYIRWAENLSWTYFLTSFVMLILLPIIPIIISCLIGLITSSLSSRFKFKNAAQIILSFILLAGVLAISSFSDKIMSYILKHATNINDFIIKLYYPAGIYAKLATDFNILDLLIFIIVNIVAFAILIFIFSRFYFKINSRLKSVTTTKKTSIRKLNYNSKPQTISLIKKELNTFIKTPVLVTNAGFALVLYLIFSIVLCFKSDSILQLLTNKETGMGISQNMIMSNISLFLFLIISAVAYMTSITNSLISLEGRNINIIKSLPVKLRTVLMSKIYACLVITTPFFLLSNLILFIKFKISIIEAFLLMALSILIPLVSHFIGIIINLKYPKLDFDNSAEVVKQSTSSFISVLIGMILLVLSFLLSFKIIGHINSTLFLLLAILTYTIIDVILYLYLASKGTKEFNKLSV